MIDIPLFSIGVEIFWGVHIIYIKISNDKLLQHIYPNKVFIGGIIPEAELITWISYE